MLHLLAAFISGVALRSLVDAYADRRRVDRVRAWESIKEGATGTRVPLSELCKRQGMYDDAPHMFT